LYMTTSKEVMMSLRSISTTCFFFLCVVLVHSMTQVCNSVHSMKLLQTFDKPHTLRTLSVHSR